MAARYPRYLATKYVNDDCMPVRQYVITDLPGPAPARMNCCCSCSGSSSCGFASERISFFQYRLSRADDVPSLGYSFGIHDAGVFRHRPGIEQYVIRNALANTETQFSHLRRAH